MAISTNGLVFLITSIIYLILLILLIYYYHRANNETDAEQQRSDIKTVTSLTYAILFLSVINTLYMIYTAYIIL
jgi:hypothetical protein